MSYWLLVGYNCVGVAVLKLKHFISDVLKGHETGQISP